MGLVGLIDFGRAEGKFWDVDPEFSETHITPLTHEVYDFEPCDSTIGVWVTVRSDAETLNGNRNCFANASQERQNNAEVEGCPRIMWEHFPLKGVGLLPGSVYNVGPEVIPMDAARKHIHILEGKQVIKIIKDDSYF